MISVCCCSINAKYDTEIFIRSLHEHNKDVDFEIVVTHDNRVNDGSGERFKKLQEEFSNLKIVTHTKQDTVDYLRACMDYYMKRSIFPGKLVRDLMENIDKFEAGELFDENRSFLWISSGLLYNKAVLASSGDKLIVTPGDFIYLFPLQALEVYMENKMRDGRFYGSPNAVFARISNQREEWLRQHVQEVHNGHGFREGYRWDSANCFRDYMRYPSTLDEMFVPDFRNNNLIRFSEDNAVAKMSQFASQAAMGGGVQIIQHFHGFHFMTRKTFDGVGGFTEEFFDRAFADDKMTLLAARHSRTGLIPPHLAVAWCGQGEVLPYHGEGYDFDWKKEIQKVDPWWNTHPIPSSDKPTYLYKGILEGHRMVEMRNRYFARDTTPVRLMT